MDDAQWDQFTRALGVRSRRRQALALLAGGLPALEFVTDVSAKKRKKRKKKKKASKTTTLAPTTRPPTTAPPVDHFICDGRDGCRDSEDGGWSLAPSAVCGRWDEVGGKCHCFTTLDDKPFCGRGAVATSGNPVTDLCMNGGCVAGGGTCIKMSGCVHGPVGCSHPCPHPE